MDCCIQIIASRILKTVFKQKFSVVFLGRPVITEAVFRLQPEHGAGGRRKSFYQSLLPRRWRCRRKQEIIVIKSAKRCFGWNDPHRITQKAAPDTGGIFYCGFRRAIHGRKYDFVYIRIIVKKIMRKPIRVFIKRPTYLVRRVLWRNYGGNLTHLFIILLWSFGNSLLFPQASTLCRY